MNFCKFKPKLLVLAAVALFTSSSFAAVEYVGNADSQIQVLKTYGVDVPTRSGLKSVLPQGWTLFIHKSAHPPELMSWKPGDTWTHALEDLVKDQPLALRVDWDRKTVTIEPPRKPAETALSTGISPAAPAAATIATTSPSMSTAPTPAQTPASPVLKNAAPTRVAQESGIASAAPHEAAVVNPLKLQTPSAAATRILAPSEAPLATGPAQPLMIRDASLSPISAVPTAEQPKNLVRGSESSTAGQSSAFPQSGANAQVGGSAQALAEQITKKFGYVLSWNAPDVEIPGAVTLLGVDIAEDAQLLQKAIGENQTPLAIEVYRGSGVMRVMPRNQSSQTVSVINEPYNGPIASRVLGKQVASSGTVGRSTRTAALPQTHTQELSQTAAPSLQRVTPASTSEPVVASAEATSPTVVASVSLSVQKGESLANALKAFFLTQGWDLRWQANTDLQATYPVSITDAGPKQIMSKLLPKLGLAADFYNPSKIVVIRPADATTN